MHRYDEQELYILYAVQKLGDLTPAQMMRYLFETGISEKFDLKVRLAALKEEGCLRQSVTTAGIVYQITQQGEEALNAGKQGFSPDKLQQLEEKGKELGELFAIEKDYIAQYTEQANAIVPVFLSIREGQKILLKVSVIVPDVETAKAISSGWAKNAQKTYRAVWDCIGEGLPFPEFEPY